MARPRTDAREQLLARVVEHLADHGVAGLSLRELAGDLGTSHRMLVYHFGSKAGLLAEVVRHVEAAQRAPFEALAAAVAAGADGADGADQVEGADQADQVVEQVAERMWAMWAHWLEPSMQRQERLFFEMVGMALQGDPTMQPLLDDLVTPWLEPIATLRMRQGVGRDDALAEARLALAVTRGLLLDVLATGDREAATRAFVHFGRLLGVGRG
jgi:AcrR family transcriptional regulator